MALPFFPDTRRSLIQALGHSDTDYPGGWEKAWTDFLLCYYPFILRWCHRWDPLNAADLTQEVLLQLVRKIDKFDPAKGTKFRGWLKVVVKNAMATAYRPQARHALPMERVDLAKVPAKVPDEALASLDQELEEAALLAEVRARVKPTCWKAFWEYKVEGRPVNEVATELDMTIQAVCVTSTRIARMLQKAMGDSPAPGKEPTP